MAYEFVDDESPQGRYVFVEDKPASVKAGGFLRQIPRQLGLTARYALEGPAQALQVVTEPLRYITDRAVGVTSQPLGVTASQFADRMGLPKPDGADERVVADATRLGFGAATFGGGAGAVSNLRNATKAVTPLAEAPSGFFASRLAGAKEIAPALASNPVTQIASAAGAGAAGGSVREAGGGELEQAAAALVGGVAGGLAPGGVQKITSAIQNKIKPVPMAQLEGKIALALKEQDIDWKMLPKAIRDRMLDDVKKASPTGEGLDSAALKRLADFRATGLTPTRGMLTLDPVQITREQNLAKIGANTADEGLQGLALTQNRNNTQLIANLNRLGASQGDPLQAGEHLANTVFGRQAALRSAEQAAWDAAKNSPGYRMPVSAQVLSDVNGALDAEGLMPFMNPTISRYMEAFQRGQPFTPQAYRNLQSMLSREMAKGGNEGAAAGLAARILKDAELKPAGFAAHSGGMVTGQMAGAMRAADGAADDAVSAVNAARAATKRAYAFEESSPVVKAILSDGSAGDPQRIASRFILGGTPNETAEVVRLLGPNNITPVKNAVLAHLKESAIGKGTADEVGKFSQSAFNRAMAKIGERKLSLLFTPEEIAQLQANGRVASYMQVQPAGAAVNNSNSGALMLGQGYDWINALAGKVPFGKQAIIDPLRSIDISLSQRQAQNITPALMAPRVGPVAPRVPMASGLALGGLLAAPGLNNP